jgi:alanine racemase
VLRGPVAEISLSAIGQNLQALRKIVRNCPVIAVVKADAYGHGAVEVSKRLLKEGISYLAVAYINEAVELRDAGITIPIIVLFDTEDAKSIFDYNLIPVICDMDNAIYLSKEAKKRKIPLKVHVKVDTGMGRMGLHGGHIITDLMKISGMQGLEITGLLSHFSEADLADRKYAKIQLERFNEIRETVSEKLNRRIFSHIANSAAILSFQEAHLDAVRPGLMLYGYSPFNQKKDPPPAVSKAGKTGAYADLKLSPAMSIKTRILCIRNVPSGTPISYGRAFITNRPSRVGVIPLGYADGYNRMFSNNADMLVNGKRVPVIGRVCMDLTMTDLTDVKGAKEGDEVVIIGRQGNESITAEELAFRTNTIPYEILTTLGSRSKRRYVETH